MSMPAAPGSLARFQDGFARALIAPQPGAITDLAPQVASLLRQPGFAVYRNTVLKGCVDALQANYPSVARLVGQEWFRAAALVFVREQLPTQATLLYYGEAFAEFLARFGPAAELPYLPGVAHLDRFWTESHGAPDESALDPVAFAGLAPEAFAATVLHPHPAARWRWFPGQPIYSIWQRNRDALDGEGEIEWRGEGALLARSGSAVRWTQLDAAGCAFLDACTADRPLAEAAAAALAAQEDADLALLMKTLLEAGAFCRMSSVRNVIPEETQQ